MKVIGNIFWFILFGLWIGILNFLVGVVFCITLVGIPLGIGFFRISKLAFFPFGKVVKTNYLARPKGHVVWLALCGSAESVGYAIVGGICCATIIGIPFGIQFFKLTRLAALPYGSSVTKKEKKNKDDKEENEDTETALVAQEN